MCYGNSTAMAWANAPEVDPLGTVASHRMTIARGFARHMAGLDSSTEIPPFGVIGARRHRHEPYIFSPTDIDALMRGAQGLRTRLACATHRSMIGLLAATGMRVGEVIRLDRADLCSAEARLLIHESKFGKSRIVPLHPSVLDALQRYASLRDAVHPRPTTASFFVSSRDARDMRSIPLIEPILWVDLGLVKRRDQQLRPHAAEFWDVMVEQLRRANQAAGIGYSIAEALLREGASVRKKQAK